MAVKFRIRLLLAVIIFSLVNTGCTKSKDTESKNTVPSVVETVPPAVDNTPKPADSDSPKAVDNNSETSENTYIFSDSQNKKLTATEIMALKPEMLPYARNEIYARRGYIFNTQKYTDYFAQKSWYKPKASFNTKDFSAIELYNINLIKHFEDQYNNKNEGPAPLKNVYKADATVLFDLNGDGVKEKIIYRMNKGELLVNNKIVSLNLDNPVESFAIVDLDSRDKFKEILISDYGPSDDYSTYFYHFDGVNIVQMGKTQGLFEFGISFNGSGKITANTRASILQTWFFNKNYQLSKQHKLEEIYQELYPTDYDVTLKIQLKLYKNRGDSVPSVLINKSQTVKIIGTDNNEWCLIKTANGIKGWIAVDKYNIIRNNGLEASEVFDGLCYAD